MSKINIAIIRVGYWGSNLVKCFSKIKEARIHTVCDTREERLNFIKSQYPNINLTKNFNDVLKNLIYLGLNCTFGYLPVKKAAILMYHSVNHNKVFFTVKPENFRKQMNYLYQKKYNIVSLSELVNCLINKKEILPKTVVLTFDDGYEDNYFNVFPALKRYDFRATIFLATNFVGKKIPNSANIPLPALNWQQIQEMHSSGLIDFEPHTKSHPKLNKISLEEARDEILGSKELIEKQLNKICNFFAYPKGNFNEDIKKILKEGSFLGAVTIKEGLVSNNDDPFSLKRNSIDSQVTFSQFKGKLNLSVDIFRKIFKI